MGAFTEVGQSIEGRLSDLAKLPISRNLYQFLLRDWQRVNEGSE